MNHRHHHRRVGGRAGNKSVPNHSINAEQAAPRATGLSSGNDAKQSESVRELSVSDKREGVKKAEIEKGKPFFLAGGPSQLDAK